MSGPSLSGGTNISATFTPNLGHSLSQAAQVCGFTDFDWVQTITRLPDPSPFSARNNGSPFHLTSASTPFNGPPAGGGYTYEAAPDNSFPFYYDPNGELATHETANTLSFFDAPGDPCLSGPSGMPSAAWLSDPSIQALCGHSTAPKGSSLAFTTHVAGVRSDRTAQDLGIGFSWTDSFNGTVAGIATTKNSQPADPGSGLGGVAILSVQRLTTYQSIVVTAKNGVGNSGFDVCVQDNSNGNLLQFNSQTGDYLFTQCGQAKGLALSGRGKLNVGACTVELKDVLPDRSIQASLNLCSHTGAASIRVPSVGGTLTIVDSNTLKNTCRCP
jgi:hypothetical protein